MSNMFPQSSSSLIMPCFRSTGIKILSFFDNVLKNLKKVVVILEVAKIQKAVIFYWITLYIKSQFKHLGVVHVYLRLKSVSDFLIFKLDVSK